MGYMKKWNIQNEKIWNETDEFESIIESIMQSRGLSESAQRQAFLNPVNPHELQPQDVGIDQTAMDAAVSRIQKAIREKESIVVYADYDADGITAGAIMWETIWKMGGRVMPYIPHRVEEGYGLSTKGIDTVHKEHNASLVITVDHGISAYEHVLYAQRLGMDVIVTDHHVRPHMDHEPTYTIVHTTQIAGSAVSWFVAKELWKTEHENPLPVLELAAIGTIADLLPLTGVNRSIVRHGLSELKRTKRVGLLALMKEAGIEKEALSVYAVSHMMAPRINAMGRIDHALDALRLLCTTSREKAVTFASKLGTTNKERQDLTQQTVAHARQLFLSSVTDPAETRLIFLSHESYNPGIIGLVAGRLVEEFYRPAIVLGIVDGVAKASARSIPGFNIIEAIRSAGDLLVDAGGHPMAAGFTVETKHLAELKARLEKLASETIRDEQLVRELAIDACIPLSLVTERSWELLQAMYPFGFGNTEPVFVSQDIEVLEKRTVGREGKHIKLRITGQGSRERPSEIMDAIAFNFAEEAKDIESGTHIDIAYAIDRNEWRGRKTMQLKVRDIHVRT